MDYEKKYNEALKRAKQLHNVNPSSSTAILICEQIFPELRESEDERIRTLLVSLVQWAKTFNQSGLDSNTANKMLSYLEKPEQKPWSEEDDAHRKSIISTIEMCMNECKRAQVILDCYESDIAWLKSLRSRPKTSDNWKPSEEDKRIIKGIIGKIDHDQTYGISKDEMLNFLKKL